MRPRTLNTHAAPAALSTLAEPVRQVLEDMREQRMSLCQSLRQYVFVHQAVVEGVLALVDHAERARPKRGLAPPAVPNKAKRRHSPTGLVKRDRKGAVALAKRPSLKRMHTSATAMPP